MKKLWLLCPVGALNSVTLLFGRIQNFTEHLVTYIEFKQDKILQDLQKEFYTDK